MSALLDQARAPRAVRVRLLHPPRALAPVGALVGACALSAGLLVILADVVDRLG
jgi:hypothetical protein